MKLDKVRTGFGYNGAICGLGSQDDQDNSGTIERDEFLALPQVSTNPLATRYSLIRDPAFYSTNRPAHTTCLSVY